MQLRSGVASKTLVKIEPSEIFQDRLIATALPPTAAGYASDLKALGARDVLVITREGPLTAQRHESHAESAYHGKKSVFSNNCHVAVLHGSAASAAMSQKTLARFETILFPTSPSLAFAVPALIRHARRGRLKVAGTTAFTVAGKSKRYLVAKSLVPQTDNRQQYAPAGLTPLQIIRLLDGLNYVVLRWIDPIEHDRHAGDIELLATLSDANEITRRFEASIGTFPVDIYSEDGSGGFCFNNAPYHAPSMARRMLESAFTRPSGVRVPNALWRYLSFAYHLLFHIKSRRVPPGTDAIGPKTFPAEKYTRELHRLAAEANQPLPQSFDDIESALKQANAWPSIDLIGFYVHKNRFLKHRYFENQSAPPGLISVFVRDFGRGSEPVEPIRKMLARTFDIVAEGPVSDQIRSRVLNSVRGGNWSDPDAPDGQALPIHWFVCWDRSPTPPTRRTRKKQPRVDNEHVNLKYEIREYVGEKVRKQQRLIHTSDNTTEALEHVDALGCKAILMAHPVSQTLKL